MPLEIRGAHLFNSECTISAGNTLRIGTGLFPPELALSTAILIILIFFVFLFKSMFNL